MIYNKCIENSPILMEIGFQRSRMGEIWQCEESSEAGYGASSGKPEGELSSEARVSLSQASAAVAEEGESHSTRLHPTINMFSVFTGFSTPETRVPEKSIIVIKNSLKIVRY